MSYHVVRMSWDVVGLYTPFPHNDERMCKMFNVYLCWKTWFGKYLLQRRRMSVTNTTKPTLLKNFLFEKLVHKLSQPYQWTTALFIQWRVSRFSTSFQSTWWHAIRPSRAFSLLLSPGTKRPRPRKKWQLFTEILQNLSFRGIFYPLPEMSTRAFDPQANLIRQLQLFN